MIRTKGPRYIINLLMKIDENVRRNVRNVRVKRVISKKYVN